MAYNERQKIIGEIKSHLMASGSPEVISIIFNDNEEIQQEDAKKITREIIQKIDCKKAAIIYQGGGGDTKAAFALGISLRKRFSNDLKFLLPEKACSAHVLPIFFSNYLCMDKNAYLTPVDPSLYHLAKHYSCCRLINDGDHQLRKKAKDVYELTASMVFKTLRTEGSLIIDPRRLDINTEEKIVRAFLNPRRHYIQIGYDDLKGMNFEVNLADENNLTWKLIKKVQSMSLLELADKKNRYLVETYNKSL